MKRGACFITSFDTRSGDCFEARLKPDRRRFYPIQGRFHDGGAGFMVRTHSLERQLSGYGFRRIRR